MNALKNRVQLIGNLGNEPEIIMMESGRKLAKFAIDPKTGKAFLSI